MSTIYSRVSRVASWAGWCSPCEREDRPLVLTRSGPGGLTSWLSGLSDEDRLLLLTCRVCGQWQLVPAREEDDPEIVLEEDLVEVVEAQQPAAAAAQAVAELVSAARQAAEAPAAPRVPAGRLESRIQPPVEAPVEVPVEVLVDLPAAEAAAPEAPPVQAPAAAVPAPRPAVERIVTVPESESVTLPAFSPEAVEAAARVLAAARAQTEPGEAPRTAPRPAALDRSRRAGVPTPRHAELPPVVGLPAGTRQVVLAAAS